MSFLTYIASDFPIPESNLLWPLSLGGEDIYTQKQFVAEVIPDLGDLESLAGLLKEITAEQNEIEIWRIWQGVAYRPVIRSRELLASELTSNDLETLLKKDVANASTTEYNIPVQYRIVLIHG